MSDIFRKSVLNRLPAMPPTKAPWAGDDEDPVEELDGDDEEGDGIQELGAAKSFTRVNIFDLIRGLSSSSLPDLQLETHADRTARSHSLLPNLSRILLHPSP